MGMGKIESLILSLMAFLIKFFGKNKLLILNYHRVQDKNNVFFMSDIDHYTFNWQMHIISQYLTPIDLTDAVLKLENNKLLAGSIAVTFDDGYKDNFSDALPILKKMGVPATFFIATGFLNGGIMWNDVVIESIKRTNKDEINLSHVGLKRYSLTTKGEKIIAIEHIINAIKYKSLFDREELITDINEICEVKLPDNLMMNDDEVNQLYDSGMAIGGHTSNHPIFSCESNNVVEEEVLDGKFYLEKILHIQLSAFAYPNGKLGKDYEPIHADIIKKAGFKCAVSTNWGVNNKKTDLYQLMRFTPWDKTPIGFLLRLLRLVVFKHV